MGCLEHTITVIGNPVAIVTRPVTDVEGKSRMQTLYLTGQGTFCELLGTDTRSGLKIGRALDVKLLEEDYAPDEDDCLHAAYDAFSDSVYITFRLALLRLDRGNRVTLVAGHTGAEDDGIHIDDGLVNEARFFKPRGLCTTNRGTLYLVDNLRIRKVQLPESWRAGCNSSLGGRPDVAVPVAATLTTLCVTDAPLLCGMAYRHASDSLIYATTTAVYQLPLRTPAPGVPAPQRKLLVEAHRLASDVGIFDLFNNIVVDAHGCVFVAHVDRETSNASIRKLALDGTVSTLATFANACSYDTLAPIILPNGYLALCAFHDQSLRFLDLGLQPDPYDALPTPQSPDQPPPRTLAADLGSLLDRQPDSSADVTVVVGDRSFPAHRAILAARCDYFRQRLEGDFPDSTAAQLALPDVDADVFALLLRYVYTGIAAAVPSMLVRRLAELADRLLLPELRATAQAQVLAEVAPETVVDAMLWADAAGDSFQELQEQLKGWFLAHGEEVVERCPDGVKRLMEGHPELFLGVVYEGFQSAKKKMRSA